MLKTANLGFHFVGTDRRIVIPTDEALIPPVGAGDPDPLPPLKGDRPRLCLPAGECQEEEKGENGQEISMLHRRALL